MFATRFHELRCFSLWIPYLSLTGMTLRIFALPSVGAFPNRLARAYFQRKMLRDAVAPFAQRFLLTIDRSRKRKYLSPEWPFIEVVLPISITHQSEGINQTTVQHSVVHITKYMPPYLENIPQLAYVGQVFFCRVSVGMYFVMCTTECWTVVWLIPSD